MSADPQCQAPLLETVMTTTGTDGVVNCAAMGVRWGEREVAFWPFHGTRTLRNLRAHGEAVVHLTDDVLLFVQSALGRPQPAVRAATEISGSVIEQASHWRELVVSEITPAGARALVRAKVVASGTGAAEPAGLCRARHAVVEASILASRVRVLGAEHVRAELERLQPLVDKTAGPREREAMAYVREYLADHD
ncbi:MAG: DUF447 family protein [Solirubrobacterales bacterium]|nr:DUF447 family protein [Solirubrobacterales bacterium]